MHLLTVSSNIHIKNKITRDWYNKDSQSSYLFFCVHGKHFTINPISGATKSTLTFQEGRLGWILTRPSYRLIGTHRSTRSVLEGRSVGSSSLLSSTIKPCIPWSQIANTELLHLIVTRGRTSLALGSRYNPIATKKDSTFYVPISAISKRKLVSLLTIKMSVAVATPESRL